MTNAELFAWGLVIGQSLHCSTHVIIATLSKKKGRLVRQPINT